MEALLNVIDKHKAKLENPTALLLTMFTGMEAAVAIKDVIGPKLSDDQTEMILEFFMNEFIPFIDKYVIKPMTAAEDIAIKARLAEATKRNDSPEMVLDKVDEFIRKQPRLFPRYEGNDVIYDKLNEDFREELKGYVLENIKK